MDIRPLPVDSDLALVSLKSARDVLRQPAKALRVHLSQKRFAEYLLFELGWNTLPIEIDPAFDEDEWALIGRTRMVHSPGA